MVAVVIHGMGKRMKDDNDDDKDSLSHSNNKKARVVWSKDLHTKFVDAVKELGEQDAVPRRIAALMNVDGITTKHVASHLQKYRLRKKKAIHQADRVPSTMTQSQTSTLLLPNKKDVHQFHTEIYSPPDLNMSGVAAPSTLTRLIQSQNINHNSLNIHPPPSTFPTHSQNNINNSYNIHPSYDFPPVSQTSTLLRKKKVVHQSDTENYSLAGFNITGVAPSALIHPTQSQYINIHPSYNFPLKQTSTLLLPNNMPLHQSHPLPNTQIYRSGVTPSTLIRQPTLSQNINDSSSIIHPPPSTFPTYHQHNSTFPTLVNQSTTPPVFATTLDFHDTRSRASNCPFVGSSSKSPSIWDYDWYTKYMKREPHLNYSLPALESDKTSQNSQMNSQQTEPFMDGFASSLEDTNIDISDYNLCSENSPIDFSVEETNCNTLDFHDVGAFVGSASSKSTSIWDCDWYTKYLKRESESLQFSHNSLPVLESDINNSHNVEPFTVGPATSLEDKNINIWCNDDTPIDFSVEETDPNTLEDIRNMGRFIEDEDLINAWKCFQEEDVTNVMQQPSCY